jgi:phosphoglycolate phosphatase-like HAD superfamily hydrolase
MRLKSLLGEMVARSLFVEAKKLRVFDFDDTLIKTDSYIYIKQKSGKKLKLTPGEYAVYTPKSGDEMDFSDFHAVKNPQPIKKYFNFLQALAKQNETVYILTARGAYQPIKKFIEDSGIRNVYVVAVGSSDPQKKADWIEDQIKTNGIDDVVFVDDSPKNIDAVRNMLKRYPKVKNKLYKAKD